MKLAAAYERNGKVIVHPFSKTTAGVWILTEPVVIEAVEHITEIGNRIINALNASRNQVPHPTSWKGGFDPVLKVAGVRSMKAFYKSAKIVMIQLNDSEVSLIPTKNLGRKIGIARLPEKAIISILSPDELGKALLKAASESEEMKAE